MGRNLSSLEQISITCQIVLPGCRRWHVSSAAGAKRATQKKPQEGKASFRAQWIVLGVVIRTAEQVGSRSEAESQELAESTCKGKREIKSREVSRKAGIQERKGPGYQGAGPRHEYTLYSIRALHVRCELSPSPASSSFRSSLCSSGYCVMMMHKRRPGCRRILRKRATETRSGLV